MRKLLVAAIMTTAASMGVESASASSVAIVSDSSQSTQNLGAFTGVLDYQAGVLTVSLTNTSSPLNGGFITGFLFNINDADDDASGAFSDADDASTGGLNESDYNQVANASGSPFGTFELGAALGGNFLGGGNPNKGIGVGETGIFKFTITEPDGELLTALSFITEISLGNGNNGKDVSFLTRFRGFNDDGSDKVPGIDNNPVIPLPAAVWSGLVTLGGLGAIRVRRTFGRRA